MKAAICARFYTSIFLPEAVLELASAAGHAYTYTYGLEISTADVRVDVDFMNMINLRDFTVAGSEFEARPQANLRPIARARGIHRMHINYRNLSGLSRRIGVNGF